MIIHDLICVMGHFTEEVLVKIGDLPLCPECGKDSSVCYYGGKSASTDVYGSEQYSAITGEHFTSTREHDRKMAARGFQPGANVRGGPMTQGQRLPRHFSHPKTRNPVEWRQQ